MHSPFRGAILHAQFTGMKKITFRADEGLMEQARLAARPSGEDSQFGLPAMSSTFFGPTQKG
jgi:hypothetical protein